MDAPLLTPHDLIRPWRRAAIVAVSIAALELVLLVGAGLRMLARPLAHEIRRQAVSAAAPHSSAPRAAAPSKQLSRAIRRTNAPPGKARPRDHVKIMVFNGNGRAGAAGEEAGRLHGLGYLIAGTANAGRQDYATSVVMYVPGYRAEAIRLAKDIGVKVVGPLDGISRPSLDGGELAVIVGA